MLRLTADFSYNVAAKPVFAVLAIFALNVRIQPHAAMPLAMICLTLLLLLLLPSSLSELAVLLCCCSEPGELDAAAPCFSLLRSFASPGGAGC